MTYQVKLPYHPQDIVYLSETRFGAKKISKPQIYETPMSGRFVIKVDTLKCLTPLIGDEVFNERDSLFDIVSGETEEGIYNELVSSFYNKYKGFMSYVNDRYFYGDDMVPIIERSVPHALALQRREPAVTQHLDTRLDNRPGRHHRHRTHYQKQYLLHTHLL